MIQLLGAGGFAREVAALIKALRKEDVSMVDTQTHEPDYNLPTLIAIGSPQVRKNLAELYVDLQYQVLHGGLHLGALEVKEGLIVCPGTILTTNIKLGKHVILNLNCTVGHDCVIGDFVTVSPGANISGNVTIGDNCYIGTNAVIRESISICNDVIIGAGAIVVKDITEPGVYVNDTKLRRL